VLEAVTNWLTYAGIGELVCTSSTLKTLDMWGKTEPDVLLLDVRHPNQFPQESLAAFKHEYPNVRVILMSHYSFDSEHGGIPAGIDACLDKAELTDQLVPILVRLFPDRRLLV